jgi:dienelactone hydrolase
MSDLIPVPVEHAGVELVGLLGIPRGSGRRPAVMVMHTAHGLCELMRSSVSRLCELGYVAVATDMYGGSECDTRRALDGTLMMELLQTPGLLRQRAALWYEHIKRRPEVDSGRVAVLGFCFGGMCALELAREGADLKATVSFHGLLKTEKPAVAGAIGGQVAIFTGGKDPYAPADQVETLRQELTSAGAAFQITSFSSACHAFTNPKADAMGRDGIAYNAIADRVSWASTVALLESTLAPA